MFAQNLHLSLGRGRPLPLRLGFGRRCRLPQSFSKIGQNVLEFIRKLGQSLHRIGMDTQRRHEAGLLGTQGLGQPARRHFPRVQQPWKFDGAAPLVP
jgi:hypothetical protein